VIALHGEPALVQECALGPRDDPLVALLEAAYRALGPEPSTPENTATLVVAGDGSTVGQRRIFERAAEIGRALPPRFIPHRLSNGAASQLAIRFQHTGRVLTFADGPASLFRSLRFLAASAEAALGPGRAILLCGDVDDFDSDHVRGAAIALELRRESPRTSALFRTAASAGDAEATPSDSRSLLVCLGRVKDWPSAQAFCDPEKRGENAWILGARS
jgi:hypothetical protein